VAGSCLASLSYSLSSREPGCFIPRRTRPTYGIRRSAKQAAPPNRTISPNQVSPEEEHVHGLPVQGDQRWLRNATGEAGRIGTASWANILRFQLHIGPLESPTDQAACKLSHSGVRPH